MNDIINIEGSPQGNDDQFERLVRRQLHSLADHAPATVRQIDEIVVGPERVGRRGQRRRLAGIGATIAALLGGLGITAVALSGADSGGAGTPSEAVQLFVEALDNEDVLGMIDVLDPAEVPAFRAAAEQGSAEAKRIDLLDTEFSLDGVAGVDMGVDGLALQTEQLTENVAVVTATDGTVTASFDPATFAFGATLREILGAPAATSTTTELGPDGHDLRLATVQRDGRWFVSVSYTIAEYVRRGAEVDLPVGPGVAAEGFDSPEAAATAFFERLAALDFEGVVATAAPGEGDAVRQYAPLWLPAAAQVSQNAHDAGLQLAVSAMGFESTGEGDRRTLQASTFVIDGALPDDSFSAEPDADGPDAPLGLHIERADGCTTWSGPGAVAIVGSGVGFGPLTDFEQLGEGPFRSCNSSSLGVGMLVFLGAAGPTELPDVATVQVDGRWYVSPVGTAAASVVDVLREVPDSQSLFDSAVAPFIFGTSRGLLEMIYVGRTNVEVPPECLPLFEFDPTGIVDAVVDDPAPADVRACNSASSSFYGVATDAEAAEVPPTSVAVDVDG